MNISVNVEVANETIQDLLTGAVEGGSNYWGIFRCDPTYESSITPESSKRYGFFVGQACYPMYSIEHPDYCLEVKDVEDDKTYAVRYSDFKKGINIMANLYPQHFKNVITKDHDAETSDVFIQCTVFGEIIYG